MKYVVIEIQTYVEGNIGTIVNSYDDLPTAFNKFYTICAAAAVSALPIHTAVILTNDGVALESKTFSHETEEE